MPDSPQWYPEAAIAALMLVSALFAIAGLSNLLGILNIELYVFEYRITSPVGNVLWTTTSLLFVAALGFLLRRKLADKS